MLLPHLAVFCQNACYGRRLAIWTAFLHCIFGQRRMPKGTIWSDCWNRLALASMTFEEEFLAEDHDLLELTLCGLLACTLHKHNLQSLCLRQFIGTIRDRRWLVPYQTVLLCGKIIFTSLLASRFYPCLPRSKNHLVQWVLLPTKYA